VSEPPQSAPRQQAAASIVEGEEVDALPVLGSAPQAVRARLSPGSLPAQRQFAGAMIPAVQAAAVAAGGFVAGAAVVGLVHRRHKRSPALSRGGRAAGDRGRRARRGGRTGDLVQIVGSRSFLLDVHLLGGTDGR
jgi:hypothetical protein